jgi:hypothetical protein
MTILHGLDRSGHLSGEHTSVKERIELIANGGVLSGAAASVGFGIMLGLEACDLCGDCGFVNGDLVALSIKRTSTIVNGNYIGVEIPYGFVSHPAISINVIPEV